MWTQADIAGLVVRKDVYAVQFPNGSWHPVHQLLTPGVLRQHMAGEVTIGTYIPHSDNTTHIVVMDFDNVSEESVRRVRGAVEYLTGYQAPIENSGRKGWHLWILLGTSVPALRARDAARWVLRLLRLEDVEVFPKTAGKKYGSIIKLPGGLHQVTKRRCVIEGRTEPMTDQERERFLRLADRWTAMQHHIESTRPGRPRAENGPGPVGRFLRGEVQVGERNRTVHAFATWARWYAGLPDDLVLEWVSRLNAALAEPLEDHEVRTAVQSAVSTPPPVTNYEGRTYE